MASTINRVGNIAQALANVNQAASRPAFELQFSQMQNTIIDRLNTEIHKVNEAGGSKSEILKLQSEGKKLAQNQPLIEKFMFDTETNNKRLGTVYDKLASMVDLFSNDNTISADDVTSFHALKQEATDELNKLWQLRYTGFTDGDIITRLKNEIASFDALAPVEGVVDAEGTTPATNVNREILTSLETMQNKVSTAQSVTSNSIYAIHDMREELYANMSDVQAGITEINSTVQLAKQAEVEKLKEKYANLLHSISLSYEVSSGIAEGLNKNLSKQSPATGSVLNLFT